MVSPWFVFVDTLSNAYGRDLNDFLKNKLLPWEVTKKLIPWDVMFIVYFERKIEPQVTGMNFLLYSYGKMLCSDVDRSRKRTYTE